MCPSRAHIQLVGIYDSDVFNPILKFCTRILTQNAPRYKPPKYPPDISAQKGLQINKCWAFILDSSV